ncbi:MAG TPA: RNA-binding S4 domain-containing protein [Desulfobulbaceae bacterium]|nr:RNA-binding S4 domain-containing protein [Desulfobulbaceae bacterium]
MDPLPTCTIRDAYIELYKILKIENMVASGGEAKYLISKGLVLVNGEVETRKRRKTVPGDIVEYNGEQILITSKP